MNNKKVIGISVAAVIILVIAIIATSYAVFTANLTGTKQNKLTTGYVTMNCQETNFTLSNTKALTDEQGIALSDNSAICRLTSEMAGTMNVGYDIALYDVDSTSPSDSIGEDNVKVQITKKIDSAEATYLAGTSATTGVLVGDIKSASGQYDTSITNYKIDSATVTGNHTIIYTVKSWVSSEGSGTPTTTNTNNVCSDPTYTTEEACTGAGEIWGYDQKISQAGGSFSFKLKIGATQVLS